MFKDHIENNVFHFYPSCQILFEEYGISGNFQKHLFLLESLADKLIRFNDFETLRKDLLGVQKSSELFFIKFNLYSYVIIRKWLAA